MKFFIRTQGDSSVGIGCDEAALITNVDHLETPAERLEYIASVKEGLATTFGDIFGSKVTITTDEEEARLAETMCDVEAPPEPPMDTPGIEEVPLLKKLRKTLGLETTEDPYTVLNFAEVRIRRLTKELADHQQGLFTFLKSSQIENDGTPETGNNWYAADSKGFRLGFDSLCKSFGYDTPSDALYASGAWDKPAQQEE